MSDPKYTHTSVGSRLHTQSQELMEIMLEIRLLRLLGILEFQNNLLLMVRLYKQAWGRDLWMLYNVMR